MASGIIPTTNMYVGLCLCASPSVTSPLSVGQPLQVASKVTRHLVVETKAGHMPPYLREAVFSVKQAYVLYKSWCCVGYLSASVLFICLHMGWRLCRTGMNMVLTSSSRRKIQSRPDFLFMGPHLEFILEMGWSVDRTFKLTTLQVHGLTLNIQHNSAQSILFLTTIRNK